LKTEYTNRVASTIGCARAEILIEDIVEFERIWRVECPPELKAFWRTWGTGQGWTADSEQSLFVSIYSPRDAILAFALGGTIEYMPRKVAPFGDNGAGEMIVFAEGFGFGLLSTVHSGFEDLYLVSATLEEFFEMTAKGKWFE
jgi:hypothetical protein